MNKGREREWINNRAIEDWSLIEFIEFIKVYRIVTIAGHRFSQGLVVYGSILLFSLGVLGGAGVVGGQYGLTVVSVIFMFSMVKVLVSALFIINIIKVRAVVTMIQVVQVLNNNILNRMKEQLKGKESEERFDRFLAITIKCKTGPNELNNLLANLKELTKMFERASANIYWTDLYRGGKYNE